MTVGILIDRGSIKSDKLINIEKGNPGIGGTEFLLLQLFHYLNKRKNLNAILLTKERTALHGK